ncbi:Clavaminate synthase-like protein [Metschnikowia bicuspidata var. bicuspidata NRRL YB-4993]|uniref:Clavaminate synthase-like protein n=1 Tax=Metschnikowia bicuspidata var. bicuspidata NRRL YB-4993 TaxID=869754 RepID=A0A1A0HCI2_9ASCO|nr:Clavaminate synthase-like protein [Metschnikowia bicuspidata var. bicuspidata NRRL YB-4993]OBA21824.1 Clavaminate synthase-like protein [Metschnikowia bicuspidata var. bicuspidata NRRL YB-4993]
MPESAKKTYRATNRNVSTQPTAARHPLNVRPLGNLFFDELVTGPTREEQMGDFSVFPEDLFMDMVGYVDDADSLKALSHTSRVLYAYLYDEDLWKKYYTSKAQKAERAGEQTPDLVWRGSWRLSVLKLPMTQQADLKIPGNLLCSDLLYRPFQCSQIDYNTLFAKLIHEEETYHLDSLKSSSPLPVPGGRIPRVPESHMSQASFDESWNGRPFILTNPDRNRWPRWTLQDLLHRFADVKFRQEAVRWPLSLYSQYLASNCDESPLYLFDCNSIAMQTLRKEYTVPAIFQPDLFTNFGKCRPDHAWLIIGSQRSGSTFHKDPNYTSAWNTAIAGRKIWVMFPPGVCPPGVSTDEEESEVTCPVGIAEWVLSGFFNDAANLADALIGITFPGECMYVPSGWWHTVINLDESIALTQNFVPDVKLGNALHFLKNKGKQISGFRPLEVRNECKAILESLSLDEKEGAEDISVLTNYCEAFDKRNLKDFILNEDCGEIMESELPPLPVFELFRLLLLKAGKKEQLQRGMMALQRKENAELQKAKGVSERWQKLTESSSTFSFGFSVSDNESE